jgi:hypothetical protein
VRVAWLCGPRGYIAHAFPARFRYRPHRAQTQLAHSRRQLSLCGHDFAGVKLHVVAASVPRCKHCATDAQRAGDEDALLPSEAQLNFLRATKRLQSALVAFSQATEALAGEQPVLSSVPRGANSGAIGKALRSAAVESQRQLPRGTSSTKKK